MTAPELTPTELAVVERFEQAPDALGLREEVATAAVGALVNVLRLPEWMQAPALGRDMRPLGEFVADALTDLIEAREKAAAARALRDAGEAFATGSWLDAFMAGNVEDDVSAVRATETWLRDRADRMEAGQ